MQADLGISTCRTTLRSGYSDRRSWSPDRKTIDAQLNEMKKRVSMDVSAFQVKQQNSSDIAQVHPGSSLVL